VLLEVAYPQVFRDASILTLNTNPTRGGDRKLLSPEVVSQLREILDDDFWLFDLAQSQTDSATVELGDAVMKRRLSSMRRRNLFRRFIKAPVQSSAQRFSSVIQRW